jgi:hypothetical protein
MKTSAAFICEAIRSRRLLEFDYRGLHRVAAPYCHGISTAGTEVMRAVQIRGASSRGGSKVYGFGKLWSIADIERPRLLEEVFAPDDPDYNPDDKGMREIHCRIEK